jgi:hypothetical protein
VSCAGRRGPEFDPQLRAGVNILPPLPNPVGGTRVSGQVRLWDPRVRSDRPWDPRVRSVCGTRVSGPSVGPACQVGPTRGTRVSGQTDAWDPRVRSDRRVGPACQVGPTRGTRVSGWSDEIQVYDGWVLHST